MKKLLLVCVLGLAAFVAWKYVGNPSGNDPLADIEHRLQAAETAYRSAGRSSGMTGMDTSSEAEAALAEVGRVEKELREMSRTATNPEVKERIHRMLDRAAMIRKG